MQVFIIHGNHDDPAGQGNFSALDELSTAGLLNYFGKQVDPAEKLHPPCPVVMVGSRRRRAFAHAGAP